MYDIEVWRLGAGVWVALKSIGAVGGGTASMKSSFDMSTVTLWPISPSLHLLMSLALLRSLVSPSLCFC